MTFPGGVVAGIIAILVGLIIIIWPRIIAYVIGVFLIVEGIIAIISSV